MALYVHLWCKFGWDAAEFYFAIERIPLGIGVALEFSGPLLLALLSSKRKKDLIWVALAILGIVFLLPDMNGVDALDQLALRSH